MAMIDVLRSSVNTWDCDQMGHMNVRHYFGRANDGLALLAMRLGLGPSVLRQNGLALRATDQHVRFIREMQAGAAYVVSAGVLDVGTDHLHTYQEIRTVLPPGVSATILSEVELVDARSGERRPFPMQAVAQAADLMTRVPVHGAPRGIERVAPRTPPLHGEALHRGLHGAYLGPALPEDCDAHGYMTEAAHMARVSDGIVHFFVAVGEGLRPTGAGGAALEYRFVFHERPRLGDIIEVRSALKGLGNKTMHICHWIFNLETGRCAATSEAVTVSFDLITRKSVAIPDDIRAVLETRVVPDVTV